MADANAPVVDEHTEDAAADTSTAEGEVGVARGGSFDWSTIMQDDEDEDSDSGDEARQTQAKRVTDSDEMWSGPRAEAGTLEELEEMLEQQGIIGESDESDEDESDEEIDENALSLKMVAPPIEKSEPVRQLSKKEQKRLEDEAFERELAEALKAAGAPPLADATTDAGAPAGDGKDDNGGDGDGDSSSSSSSKKKKKKKNKKKGGGDGESGDAAAPAAAPVVELTPKSEEEIEKAKEALAAKLKEKAAKKALSRKNANEKLKAAEKKRAEKKKRDLAFAKSASGGPKFSSDNQVGGDGRGG